MDEEKEAAHVDRAEDLREAMREEFKQLSHQLRKDMRQELQQLQQSHQLSKANNSSSKLQATHTGMPQANHAHTGMPHSKAVVHTALRKVQPKIPAIIGGAWGSSKPVRGHKNQELIKRFMGDPAGTDQGPQEGDGGVKLRPRQSTWSSSGSGRSSIGRAASKESSSHPGTDDGSSIIVQATSSVKDEFSVDEGNDALRDAASTSANGCCTELEVDNAFNNSRKSAVTSDNSCDMSEFTKRKRKGEATETARALGLMMQRGRSSLGAAMSIQTEELDPIRKTLLNIGTSARFEFLTLALIFSNAFVIGLQTDYMARRTLKKEPAVFRVFDILFCIFFTLEIALKLTVWRCRFFRMWGWAWNVFDLTLVFMQLVEEITHLLAVNTSAGIDSTLLRTVRVLRAIRVVRVLRVMSFAQNLQLLVSCILHSFSSFFWACALLFLMVYIMSIYITQLVLNETVAENLSLEGRERLKTYFGTVPLSMLSLVEGLLGGLDWNDLVDPIRKHISWWLGLAIVIYIVFSLLAVMNVITGNFVQSSLEGANEIKDVHRLNQARKMFVALDTDVSGTISFDELGEHLDSPIVQEFFASLDIDVSEARSLFELIDMDNSGVIDFEEFLCGCMRLHGPAKATDLLLVTRDFRNAFEQQGLALTTLEQHLCCIKDAFMPGEGSLSSMSLNPEAEQDGAQPGARRALTSNPVAPQEPSWAAELPGALREAPHATLE